jgi:chitin-binding protein
MEVTRMRARHAITLLAAGLLAALPALLAAGPARAHGATDEPVSRTWACAPDGPYVASQACQDALAASGREAFDDWDYLHVAGVAGRDREVVPDGRLCSGGVPGYAGLDLPGTRWPTTTVDPDADITFRYRTTIPHQGSFRLYVTADGYDPAQPLRWADLEPEPFLTVADPPLAGGAYEFEGRLPSKDGRHVIYTIWQNTDTPDTYYSCSDVSFGTAQGAEREPSEEDAEGAPAQTTPPAQPGGLAAARTPAEPAVPRGLITAVAAGAILAVVVAAAISAVRRRGGA